MTSEEKATGRRSRESQATSESPRENKRPKLTDDDQNNNNRVLELQKPPKQHQRRCPYLGTINRHVLDFDFEKLCSVSLSSQRPYGCLTCGKYFQGRGVNTYAMTHALECHHYMFINLLDAKVYCLPDNWEVEDASLDDIKYHLNPVFTEAEVKALAVSPVYGKALDGSDFIPGCIGLNNLNKTDYFNVVVQTLCAVVTFRHELLLADFSKTQSPDPVLKSLSELFRKIFNCKNFKGIVSPHEFLQAVGVASQKRFRIGHAQDPLALLTWLFHRLNRHMRRKKTNTSTIAECFQGQMHVSSTKVISSDGVESDPIDQIVPFYVLTLNVPAAPVFRNALERNTIPQLPIFDLLEKKLDGVTPAESSPGVLTRQSLWKLPPYLVVHINRFSKNNFFLEKNPTIITFLVKSLDLRDYVHPDARDDNPVTKYDLIANTVHEGPVSDGHYKSQIFHSATEAWYELEDLRVTPTLPQMVALSESYIQVYQRQDVRPDGTIPVAPCVVREPDRLREDATQSS